MPKSSCTASGVCQRTDVCSGPSYASTSDPRLLFRLGSATKIDKLEIFWPEISLPPIDGIVPSGQR